jgi:hypothetical protein
MCWYAECLIEYSLTRCSVVTRFEKHLHLKPIHIKSNLESVCTVTLFTCDFINHGFISVPVRATVYRTVCTGQSAYRATSKETYGGGFLFSFTCFSQFRICFCFFSLIYSSSLKMETVSSLETSGYILTIRRYKPENLTLQRIISNLLQRLVSLGNKNYCTEIISIMKTNWDSYLLILNLFYIPQKNGII